MSRWWRAYDRAVDDPKLQTLRPDLFKAWFNLCCICSQNNGTLPGVGAIAFKLRISSEETKKIIEELVSFCLIDIKKDGRPKIHDWDKWQYKSDTSTPRVKRFRNGKRNGHRTVSETPPEQIQSRAETEQIRADIPAGAGGEKYAFDYGTIRLTKKDLDAWKRSFKNLDVEAELTQLEPWAAEQTNWFCAVSAALNKRNREQRANSNGQDRKSHVRQQWDSVLQRAGDYLEGRYYEAGTDGGVREEAIRLLPATGDRKP